MTTTSADTLLVMEKSGHALAFFDLASGECRHRVALPDYPHEFVVDAGERFAYVGHYGVRTSDDSGAGGHEVIQVDLRKREVARRIDCDRFNRLHGMRLDGAGRLMVLSEGQNVLLTLPEPASDKAPRRAVPTGGIKAHLFALTRDGRAAFATHLLSHTVTRIDPLDAGAPPLACAPGDKPEGCALSPDERTLYVTCRQANTVCAIDPRTMRLTRSAPGRGDPLRVYTWGDGRLLVTDNGDHSVSVLDAASLRTLHHLPLPAAPAALSLHPAKPLAFVSLADDRVALLDLHARRIERFIATGREPDVSVLLQGAA